MKIFHTSMLKSSWAIKEVPKTANALLMVKIFVKSLILNPHKSTQILMKPYTMHYKSLMSPKNPQTNVFDAFEIEGWWDIKVVSRTARALLAVKNNALHNRTSKNFSVCTTWLHMNLEPTPFFIHAPLMKSWCLRLWLETILLHHQNFKELEWL